MPGAGETGAVETPLGGNTRLAAGGAGRRATWYFLLLFLLLPYGAPFVAARRELLGILTTSLPFLPEAIQDMLAHFIVETPSPQ